MKYTLNILLVICFAASAQAGDNNIAPRSATPAKPAPGPAAIPKDAVEVEPGLFETKDAAGKVWHYTHTPFGVSRFEPRHHEDTTAADAAGITVIGEDAGVVRFERKTPFGFARWTGKRDRLTAAEKMALERTASRKDGLNATATAPAKPAAGK